MDALTCIKTRRSRRLFLPKEVSKEMIKELITCAASAPSSQDSQPWQFIVIRDKTVKQKIGDLKGRENQQHILTAPIIIVVCVDTKKSPTRYVEDGVTATENLLLAANALGLGSVYVTCAKTSKPEVMHEIQRLLGLPKELLPINILPIGYPDPSEKLEKKEIKTIEKIIHLEKY